ncbi:hypothetical protein [uncultured Mucilaginibacter sp.]|uniref:hypothetical protein n=1 Tax=uncultured Mucilaginibacter sp. TaxID=797541 RepID=UPI0026039253|nr:hypothetical protein [uncultured Mucilaginibacter sp.]
MEWYNYLAALFAGAFLANTVPHFIHGISGDRFPTPFAKPPGVGLSSPTINAIWGLFNLVVGYLLFTVSKTDRAHPLSLLLLFVGIAFVGIDLSRRFQKKDRE